MSDKSTQKVTLTSNEGSNIEVGMSIAIYPPPYRPCLIMFQTAWWPSGRCSSRT